MRDPVLKRIFILCAIVLFIGVIYLLSPVVIPFVFAFFIAYLFSPVVAGIQRFFLPRWLAISIVFILIIIGMMLLGWYVVPVAWKQLLYARDHIPEMIQWINHTFLPWAATTFNLEQMQLNTDELSKVVMDYVQTNYSVDNIQGFLLRLAQSGLSFIQIGATLVLVPIVTFYFLLDWDKMLLNFRRLIPRQSEDKVVLIAQECHSVLGAFVKGQFLVMILLGLVYAVGLQLIGLRVGLIIGIIAGIASIIPYLGFAVGIIAAVIATFLQFGVDWVQLALVILVFMIGQAVEGYILQPFLLGDKIGLSPVAVVFAVLAGAQLFGFVGMLIALPVAAVLVVLLKHLRESYEKSDWYAANLATVATDQSMLLDSEAKLELAQQTVHNATSTDLVNPTDSASHPSKDE